MAVLASPVWCCSKARTTHWPCCELPVVLLRVLITVGRVEHAFGVVKKSERSIGCVLAAGRLNSSAAVPLAVFSVPVVLNKSAAAPVAVFESAVLRSSAPAPRAVLKLPVVTLNNENVPIAVFPTPKVRA